VRGSRLIRRFQLGEQGLEVDDQLKERGAARAVSYAVPSGAREVQREEGRIRYRLA